MVSFLLQTPQLRAGEGGSLVSAEINIPTPFLQGIGGPLTPLVTDDRVNIAVTHKDGGFLVRVVGGDHVSDFVPQEQVAAQTLNPSANATIFLNGAHCVPKMPPSFSEYVRPDSSEMAPP